MEKTIIDIALAPDRNYLDYALIAMASALSNTKRGMLRLHLLYDDLQPEELARFEKLKTIADFEFCPLKVGESFFSGWPVLTYSVSAYYRLKLPSLLPEMKKIIYLDCDLLVMDDLTGLWEIDLGETVIGAVPDKTSARHRAAMGMPTDAVYFNSGVLVMNPAGMAAQNHEQLFIECSSRYQSAIRYPDQDILNHCYTGNFCPLPLRWNVTSSVYRNAPEYFSLEETLEALRCPGIVHFTGNHKPWRLLKSTRHPYAFCFRRYAELAHVPWKLRAKLALKSIVSGRLKRPSRKMSWDSSIINRNIHR